MFNLVFVLEVCGGEVEDAVEPAKDIIFHVLPVTVRFRRKLVFLELSQYVLVNFDLVVED